jgi:hypothetical protein
MTEFATMFNTDPAITEEELTPAVLEEIGKLKYEIIQAIMPHWQAITSYSCNDSNIDVLGIELEGSSPDFVRALAAALRR